MKQARRPDGEAAGGKTDPEKNRAGVRVHAVVFSRGPFPETAEAAPRHEIISAVVFIKRLRFAGRELRHIQRAPAQSAAARAALDGVVRDIGVVHLQRGIGHLVFHKREPAGDRFLRQRRAVRAIVEIKRTQGRGLIGGPFIAAPEGFEREIRLRQDRPAQMLGDPGVQGVEAAVPAGHAIGAQDQI